MPVPHEFRFRCLIVEDEADFAAMEASVVEEFGGIVTFATSLAAARTELARGRFDLVILDNRLPDGTGHDFCPQLLARQPAALVIMITGVPELGQAVALTRNGLFDYLAKPVDLPVFRQALERVRLRLSRPDPDDENALMIGEAPAFRQASERLRRVARHQEAIVLLLGETGTGKEVAARQLHEWAAADKSTAGAFVALNCSAVPSEMFEAELFGAERGAYTGADRRRVGVIEAAANGTLFLDEIGDLPPNQQTKFLRFLESREFRSLGGTETRVFRGRIVAATNRDLAEEVRCGRFRQDLWYRLDVFRVELPPLRERREDLPGLIDYLLGRLSKKYGRACPTIRESDVQDLIRHPFPGNIRELRNVLERSLLHTPEGQNWLALDRSWLPSEATFAPRVSVPLHPVEPRVAASIPGADLEMTPIDRQEFELYRQVLTEEGGAIRRTAARLGVSHQVVLRRLQRWPKLREFARSRETVS